MADYILSCCSTADLTKEQFEEMDVKYICFHYEMDGKQYADDLGQTMPFDLFYQKMAQGADTKTSQVNAEEYEEYFEGFLKDGKDVLHLCLSSGISGTVNSANIAKEILPTKPIQAKIISALFKIFATSSLFPEKFFSAINFATAFGTPIDDIVSNKAYI